MKISPKRFNRLVVAAFTSLLALGGWAKAQTYSWDGAQNGNYTAGPWNVSTGGTVTAPPSTGVIGDPNPAALTGTTTITYTTLHFNASETVDSFAIDNNFGYSWAWIASATGTPALLTVTNNFVYNPSTAANNNLSFRDSSTGLMSVSIGGNLTDSGDTLSFGLATAPAINAVSIAGTASVAASAVLYFNAHSASIAGVTTLNGTGANSGVLDVYSRSASDTYTGASTGGVSVGGLAGTGVVQTALANNPAAAAGVLTIDAVSSSSSSFSGTLRDHGTGTVTNTVTLALVQDSAANSTETLTGENTYSAGTTVTAGTLLVNNASGGSGLGTGAVSVNGGVLAGTGYIAPSSANVTIGNGATLQPGSSGAGALTFTLTGGNTLSFSSGSTLALTFGATATATDSTSVAFGTLGDWLNGSAGNATLSLSSGTGGINYGDTYTVFSNVSTTGFTFSNITGYDSADYTAVLSQVGNAYDVAFQAVPEPNTTLLFLSGLAALVFTTGIWRRAPVT